MQFTVFNTKENLNTLKTFKSLAASRLNKNGISMDLTLSCTNNKLTGVFNKIDIVNDRYISFNLDVAATEDFVNIGINSYDFVKTILDNKKDSVQFTVNFIPDKCSYKATYNTGVFTNDIAISEATEGNFRFEPVHNLNITGKTFKNCMESVIDYASEEENKYVMCFVHLENVDNTIKAIATDGRRLALNNFTTLESQNDKNFHKCNLNKVAVMYFNKYLSDNDNISIQYSDKYSAIITDRITWISSQPCDFLAWQRVIPNYADSSRSYFTFNTKDIKLYETFIKAAKNYKIPKTVWNISDEGIVCTSNNSKCFIKPDTTSDNFQFALNINYFVDAVKAAGNGIIKFVCCPGSESIRPTVQTTENKPGWMSIILPINLAC